MEYEPMLTFNHEFKANRREKLLEIRIDKLRERIRELEQISSSQYPLQIEDKNKPETNKSAFLVLPVTYTPVQDDSPKLEIVPCSSIIESNISLLYVKRLKDQMNETIV
jgi:hypothetical protein